MKKEEKKTEIIASQEKTEVTKLKKKDFIVCTLAALIAVVTGSTLVLGVDELGTKHSEEACLITYLLGHFGFLDQATLHLASGISDEGYETVIHMDTELCDSTFQIPVTKINDKNYLLPPNTTLPNTFKEVFNTDGDVDFLIGAYYSKNENANTIEYHYPDTDKGKTLCLKK